MLPGSAVLPVRGHQLPLLTPFKKSIDELSFVFPPQFSYQSRLSTNDGIVQPETEPRWASRWYIFTASSSPTRRRETIFLGWVVGPQDANEESINLAEKSKNSHKQSHKKSFLLAKRILPWRLFHANNLSPFWAWTDRKPPACKKTSQTIILSPLLKKICLFSKNFFVQLYPSFISQM